MGVLTKPRVTLAAAMLMLCSGGAPIWAAPTSAEVEAVFLFNFSQFVEWPSQSFAEAGSPIVLCVLGNDPFGPALDQVVRGEQVKGRRLEVRRFRRIEEVTNCHILFVSRSERGRLEQVLHALQGRSVLTVSDIEDFARAGGVICFVQSDNKIRLRVNLEAAKAAGLTLSSKLLRPAQIVATEEG
jgi:hypothetical protein